MGRCRVDQSIERVVVDGFAFPLGAYPVEGMEPKPGFTLAFESADGDDSGEDSEWEEWPDRYVFDILIAATRVESLVRSLLAMLPGRVYPILDVLGHDAFREVDPYVSYDLIGLDRFTEALRRYRGYFFEDGLVGFGAMSDEPFLYIFVDEHKIITVRCETALKERVDALLAAFDLKEVETIAGADSATHEHRAVLDAPEERPELLTADEIVEELREEWRLSLNIDPETNVDDSGTDLGITGWRCLVRYDPAEPEPDPAEDEDDPEESGPDPEKGPAPETGPKAAPKPKIKPEPPTAPPLKATPIPGSAPEGSGAEEPTPTARYVDVLLTADSLNKAIDLAFEGFDKVSEASELIAGDDDPDPLIVATERLTSEEFADLVKQAGGHTPDTSEMKIWHSAWLA